MKRIADWLEKISAGAMLIGLFQNNLWAVAIGTVIVCIGAFIYGLHIGKSDQSK